MQDEEGIPWSGWNLLESSTPSWPEEEWSAGRRAQNYSLDCGVAAVAVGVVGGWEPVQDVLDLVGST
jgi:hypothetical protein